MWIDEKSQTIPSSEQFMSMHQANFNLICLHVGLRHQNLNEFFLLTSSLIRGGTLRDKFQKILTYGFSFDCNFVTLRLKEKWNKKPNY